MKILGVDPAQNIAAEATQQGILTIAKFFTPETARAVARKYGKASVISANNVFAHTDNVESFVEAVKELLLPNGIFVFEAQYLKDLIEKNLFDMVYHEHLCYYHLTPLVPFSNGSDFGFSMSNRCRRTGFDPCVCGMGRRPA